MSNIAHKKHILILNGGSSSIKFTLYQIKNPLKQILEGSILRIGLSDSSFEVKSLEQKENFSRSLNIPDYKASVSVFMDWIKKKEYLNSLVALGHRVVHGGAKYHQAQLVNPEFIKELIQLIPLAPEHLPVQILLIQAFQSLITRLPQIACFDTAFHHHLPSVAQCVAIPRVYAAKGVRRYGFHGLSYEFLMEALVSLVGPKKAEGRIILAHLGNGASLAAVSEAKPIESSMGFTPCSGVPMGSRSGDLDPGLFDYLARTQQMDLEQFNIMVNKQSGLVGVSELSANIADLLKYEQEDSRAFEAIDLFCYQVKKSIGAFSAALGGLDILVFSAGIGEKSPLIRSRICRGLDFLGIELDVNLNEANAGIISEPSRQVEVRVIHTDEALMIAKTLCSLLKLGKKHE